MKKIGYRRVIHSNSRRFLLRAEDYSQKVGMNLTCGDYKKDRARWTAIKEAMAVWDALNPDGVFYQRLGERLSKLKGFDTRQYYAARDAQVRDLLSRLLSIGERSENAWVHAVCRFMLLPKDVVRKWLWHENVDFQSCESFLRRLTGEQHVSLKLHYDLVKGGAEKSKLPCFAEGTLNKVWNFFGLTAKDEPNRMATKSAVAHDFLSMGMGFALYPNARDDRATKKDLATQFLSKQDRGDFEVNKEHGGLYWFLYRTLRSNPLYREGEYVELGRWICPGFWFTMIMWGILALVSPASLLTATGLHTFNGAVSLVLFGLGAILPVVVLAYWVKKFCNKEYNDEYWVNFLFGLLCAALVVLAHLTLIHAKEFWAVGAGILCILFLVPYCIKKDTFDFWDAPILGKLLPLVFLSAGAWDIHMHSDFWQDCGKFFAWLGLGVWHFLQSVAYYIYEARVMFAIIGVVFTFYIALLVGLYHLSNWMARKSDEMIEKGDSAAYYYEKMVNWGVGIALVVFVFIGSMFATNGIVGGGAQYVLYGFVSLPFLVFLAIRGANRVDVVVTRRAVRGALWGRCMLEAEMSAIREAISSNKFWVEITHSVARANILRHLLCEISEHGNFRYSWHIEMICSIKSDAELVNADKFVSSELCRELYFSADFDVLKLILSGANEDVLCEAIKLAKEKSYGVPQKQAGPSIWENFTDWLVVWLDKKALPFFIACFMFVTWPIRMLWRGGCDLYDLWNAFNEQCPQAPPRDRPIAK